MQHILRTISDKVFKDIAYYIFINPEYDGCQRELMSMIYRVLDKERGSSPIATSKMGVCVNDS